MDSIGAEVGEKMRSAIKAKLMELDCYVDDELPDYIMVMVANKRSKSQMNEDLHLFLDTKTSTFVDWLHVVLKKLKEVTVTNPEVYKKSSKRKSTDSSLVDAADIKIKKENLKKVKTEHVKVEDKKENKKSKEKSLTDDLPIIANKLAEKRKIVVVNSESANLPENDNFDIPLLSEVTSSGGESELKAIEDRIKTVKSRLGLVVESDDEEDQDFLNIKTEKDELFSKLDSIDGNQQSQQLNRNVVEIEEIQEQINEKINEDNTSNNEKQQHKRIVFDINDDKSNKKSSRSIIDRLSNKIDNSSRGNQRVVLSEFRKEEDNFFRRSIRRRGDEMSISRRESREVENRRREQRRRSLDRGFRRSRSPLDHEDNKSSKKLKSVCTSIVSQVVLPSKVSIPRPKTPEPEEPEDELKKREVPSMIRVKPRVIPPNVPQPNKNLLLKAVAEAQRSVAQTPRVGTNLKPDALFTKKYKETHLNTSADSSINSRRIKESEKLKLKNLLEQDKSKLIRNEDSEEEEYVPKPVKKMSSELQYVPSKPTNTETEIKQQFIITLDGLDKSHFEKFEKKAEEVVKPSIKSRLDGRKMPSPIIFDKIESSPVKHNSHLNIPDKLPIVHPPISIKTKERCKYWPNCRQGDKCEFVHPSTNCEMFPNCKFLDKCLYLHPVCKFGISCTKRDCIYSHDFVTKSIVLKPTAPLTKLAKPMTAVPCKYFPNCVNINCPFFHPKACKFGKFCKNKMECPFSHDLVIPSASSLTWRAK